MKYTCFRDFKCNCNHTNQINCEDINRFAISLAASKMGYGQWLYYLSFVLEMGTHTFVEQDGTGKQKGADDDDNDSDNTGSS